MKHKQKFSGILLAITLLIPFSLMQCGKDLPADGTMEKEFKNPSTENRPMALYTWMNAYVDQDKLVYEIEQMKEKGMRGALIWDIGSLMDPKKIIPDGPEFLGPESLDNISVALKTAGRLGLDFGMVAASSWNSGGPWIEPEDASKRLDISNQVVSGPGKMVIRIEAPKTRRGVPEVYKLLHTIAVPYTESKVIDYESGEVVVLDDFVKEDMTIKWDVPEGKWDVISSFMSNTGQHLVCPSPNSDGLIIDHLSKEATIHHFDGILSRLDKISTPEARIKFLMLDSYEVWDAEDWTPGFIEEFKSRYGYDPVPYIPLIKGYDRKDHNLGERFRADYHRLVSDLMIENHYAFSMEYGDEHGIQMFNEAGHGGAARVDPLKALGNAHIPMGEFWNRQRHWVTKEAASAAHLYGRKLVGSESLTGWNHWQHGPTDFKQLCDIAFCEGLNQVVFHTFSHNPEIAGKPGFVYHAGEHINVNATWWEMARPFMDYLARCSYMLRQGNFVADACLYYGDQAPNRVPPKRIDPNIEPIFEDHQCLHCGQEKTVNPGDMHGYDYDYMNADIILNQMRVEDGMIVLNSGQKYRVMLLPVKESMSLEVLKKLEQLVSDGAVIVGNRPVRATSLKNYPECDVEVKEIADRIWGDCDGEKVMSNSYGKGTVYCGMTLKEVLGEIGVAPDFEVQGIDNTDWTIDYIHRRTENEDIYFVTNSSQKAQEVTFVFRVPENTVPEIWDAETGLIQRKVDFKKVDNGISMDFVMDPLASRFVMFRKNSSGKNDEGLEYDLQYGFAKDAVPANIDITEGWTVHFNTEMGGPETYNFDELVSWSDIDNEGVQYYSGTATYTRDFKVPGDALTEGNDAFVVFENIQEMARVNVNGNDCGIVWLPPYKVDITPFLKEGSNTITVEAVNTWNNRIVGDMRNPDQDPYTRTNAKARFSAESALLKSGLIGEAEILFVKK